MRTQQLREVIRDSGPFVSVYVDASHDTEDATTRNELRWRAIHTELGELGADQATIEAAGHAVLDSPAVGQAGRAVIAAHGEVLCSADFPVPPAADLVRYSGLPYLLPLLSWQQPPVPHVIVLADKIGGALRAVDANGTPVPDTATRGEDRPVHHVAGGGPAHGSMENRAEETVRRNAKDVAEAATRLAEQVDAELPAHIRRLVTELDVNAAHTDLDAPDVTDGVTRLLAQQQAERDEAALERLHAGGAHGTACEGLDRVTEALRAGAVETVLVTDASLADRTVWRGGDPSQVATDAAQLQDEQATERRADEAVPAAALATSADILVLTGAATVADGVAALLRY